MNTLSDPLLDLEPPPPPQSGRAQGWLAGLGVIPIPWVAAGIVSTFLPNPEQSFPWVFTAAFTAMIGWVIYGSFQVPGFRRGAIIGATVTLSIAGALFALLRLAA